MCYALRASEEEKDKQYMGVVFRLYGYESKLKRAEFLTKMSTTYKWVYSSNGIKDVIKPFNNEIWLQNWEEQNL